MKKTSDEKHLEIKNELIKIKEVLLSKGWVQGSFTDLYGSHCLLGALDVVSSSYYDPACLRRHLRGALHNRTKGEVTNLVTFNDAPGRTKEEVISLIDDAIEFCKG